MAGAPVGNSNATKGSEWRQAIKRALAHRSGKTYREGLDQVARKFVEAAAMGDPWAMKEIGDRMDGKPKQSMDLDVEGDIGIRAIEVTFTDGSDSRED